MTVRHLLASSSVWVTHASRQVLLDYLKASFFTVKMLNSSPLLPPINAIRICMVLPSTTADAGTAGAIVADDEPLAPRRTAVRVMQDLCTWLLDLGLPTAAQRANKVAEESERLAVKKAQVRGCICKWYE